MEQRRGGTLGRLLSLLLNLAVVVIELFSLPICWEMMGWEMFTFYTQDFNILAMLACAAAAWYELRGLFTGRPLPLWVKRFKFVAASCLVMITGTVCLILAPLCGPGGYQELLLSQEMIANHLINPLAAALSLLVFERQPRLRLRTVWLACLPTLAYGAAILALNIQQVIKGPYEFFYVYEQPPQTTALWFALILASNLVYAALLWLLGGNRQKKGQKAIKE